MTTSPLSSPIVLDGVVSAEKLVELLNYAAEYPELDFKKTFDPTTTEGRVELAHDIGAMQVRGAYIVVGVDNRAVPTGQLSDVALGAFDEATLSPRLRNSARDCASISRNLSSFRTAIHERDGHAVVLIYVGRHPSGCAFFRADGQYEKDGKLVTRFRKGDVCWRDGTQSVRLLQQGFEEIIGGRIAAAKLAWIAEQHEIRRHELGSLQAAQLASAPLGSVDVDMTTDELVVAALELVRARDQIALRHLFNGILERARSMVEHDQIEAALAELLDKITCLAAAFLEYDLDEQFEDALAILNRISSLPLKDEFDARRFGMTTRISPEEKAPRVWLQVIERVFALGALAVRRSSWRVVRTLTIQLPERLDHEYDTNWLRHALTMASRAQHLDESDGRQTTHISLLSLARSRIDQLDCLRPDGLPSGDDAILDSLTQFDALSNLAAIDEAGDVRSAVFFPNFARLRQTRVQPVMDRVVAGGPIREAIFHRNDGDLAEALVAIAQSAHSEGMRYDGFDGWDRTAVGEFIKRHAPRAAS